MVKLLVREADSERARELWELDTPIVSSWTTYAETCAALAAARRGRRLTRRGMNDALQTLHAEWDAVEALDLDDVTAETAGALAVRHGLHGMDSIHLASALTFAEARPVVVTWDSELRRAASAEGLAVSV